MKRFAEAIIILLFLLAAAPALARPVGVSVKISSPADGSLLSGGIIPVTCSYTSIREPIARLELYVDGLLNKMIDMKRAASPGQYTFDWDALQAADGLHRLRVACYGIYGGTAGIEISITLQQTSLPQPPVEPDPPTEDGITAVALLLPASTPLTGVAAVGVSPTGSGLVDRIDYYVDGKWVFFTNSLDASFNWNTTKEYDGKHRLQACLLLGDRMLFSHEVEVTVNNGRTVTNIARLEYVPLPGVMERVVSSPVTTMIVSGGTRRFPWIR